MVSTFQDRAKALGFNIGLVDYQTIDLCQFCGLRFYGLKDDREIYYPVDSQYPITVETDRIICEYFIQIAHKGSTT